MIKHIVAFRFRDDVSSQVIASTLAELEAFPQRYPQMRRWLLGPNTSTRDQSMSHAFTVEFETEEQLLAYLGSDRHGAFVRERWRPIVERQVIVTLEG